MKKVIKVPYIDQTKEYPTGCESISTVMLLWYLKITVTPEQFIDDYLIKEPMQKKGDRLYGQCHLDKDYIIVRNSYTADKHFVYLLYFYLITLLT